MLRCWHVKATADSLWKRCCCSKLVLCVCRDLVVCLDLKGLLESLDLLWVKDWVWLHKHTLAHARTHTLTHTAPPVLFLCCWLVSVSPQDDRSVCKAIHYVWKYRQRPLTRELKKMLKIKLFCGTNNPKNNFKSWNHLQLTLPRSVCQYNTWQRLYLDWS